MSKNLEALIANPDEIDALEKYQDNYQYFIKRRNVK